MMQLQAAAPLVNLSELAEIELFILKRMQEFTLGDHASVYMGAGFNFSGLRDWEPGDSPSSIEWAQSSLTNFSPIIVRQFEQDTNAGIIVVADASRSTHCGMDGTPILAAVARSLATLGMSAVLFQDRFGLITFDDQFRQLAAARPRVGKAHVIHCLEMYRAAREDSGATGNGGASITKSIAGHLRRASLVPVISDFLFADAPRVIDELSLLNAAHDVFLIMVDARYAFEHPDVSAGWIEVRDVETGDTRVLSRREYAGMAERVADWQDDIFRLARGVGLDIAKIGLDRWEMERSLVHFVAERRLRKVKM